MLNCLLSETGQATKCQLTVNPKAAGINAGSVSEEEVNKGSLPVAWWEPDPVTYTNITFSRNARSRIFGNNVLKFSGHRLCRGIYDVIFRNRKYGFKVPVKIRKSGASSSSPSVEVKCFMVLRDTDREQVEALPDMYIEFSDTESYSDEKALSELLSGMNTIRLEEGQEEDQIQLDVSFYGLYMEIKRDIYNMNLDRIQQCFK